MLDILVQSRRDQHAAERFLRRVLEGDDDAEPRVVVTDKLAAREMFTATLIELRTAGPCAIPAQRRQAGLLLGLLRAAPGRWW